MPNTNKYDIFYSQKDVDTLIEKVVHHRIAGNLIDKQWYEGLLAHLAQREMTESQKLKWDFVQNASKEDLVSKLKEQKEARYEARNWVKADYDKILAAKKAAKKLFILLIVTLLLPLIQLPLQTNSIYYDVCSLIVLIALIPLWYEVFSTINWIRRYLKDCLYEQEEK